MTTEDRRYTPLLQRHGLRETHVRELWTIPQGLEYIALSRWCRKVIGKNLGLLYDWDPDREAGSIQTPGIAIARALNIEMPTWWGLDVDRYGNVHALNSPTDRIMSIADEDNGQVLDIIDYLLSANLADASHIDELRDHLRDGSSGWQVSHDSSGLVLRVSDEEEESYQHATSVKDSASQYLTSAWDAAWRRNQPSAKEAYGDAVNAIEAVLAPIVIPNESKPTLGKVIGELKAKHNQGTWDTRFRDVETVQALKGLLDELWQTNGRHAGMPPNTLEQAQDAVTIAVAVVALTRRGFLERVDDS